MANARAVDHEMARTLNGAMNAKLEHTNKLKSDVQNQLLKVRSLL
jgi:archaellum component FlaC